MDRQTTLAFLLIGLILMVWLYIQTPPPQPPPQDQSKEQTVDSLNGTKAAEKEKPVTAQVPAENDSMPFGKHFANNSGTPGLIRIETDLLYIEMSEKGGKFYKYFLKEFNNWYIDDLPENAPYYQKNIQLLNTNRGSSFDLSFITTDGRKISTGDIRFASSLAPGNYTLKGNDSLVLSYTLPTADGKGSIIKNFVIYGNRYDSRFTLELNNLDDVISNRAYDIVWGGGIRFVEENSVDEATAANASVYYGDEQVIVDAASPGETVEQDFNGRVDWITVRNKYFAAVMVPDNPKGVDGAYISGKAGGYEQGGVREFYSAHLKMPFKGGKAETSSFMVYIGPVKYEILDSYNRGLTTIVDFGSFFGLKMIVRPIAEYILLPLFNFLYDLIKNYGLVIIIFSLIIKVLLNPLTKQTMDSMKKMQALKPKIDEMKEKFKDDPQKQQSETMKLYSTYGINPLGGCLPLLLQMPIFIALWGTFQTAVELRQQPFVWWITDLSRPDVIFDLGFKIPLFGVQEISGLAILMGITTYLQQKMSGAAKDPSQAPLLYIMPVMLTILFMSFPSGLNLYYFLFNLFSIGQQWYVTKYGKPVELVPVPPKAKGGFFQKLMTAAEQKAKQQQAAAKKRK
ncbi:MAG: membrane protein insertase YidC [Ignavibacteriales bacterium]|nr:MAG: membrane protein insertase YidC [Ignavibacteriales bacterium]